MYNDPVQWTRIRRRVAEGESIRGVSRAEKISRKTVRKMLRSDRPSQYFRPRRLTSVSGYERLIDAMLAEDEAWPQCDRRSIAAIFRSVRDHHGYGGSYDCIRRYCRSMQLRQINFVVRPLGDDRKGVPLKDIRCYYRSMYGITLGKRQTGYRLFELIPGRSYEKDGEITRFDRAAVPSSFRAKDLWASLSSLERAQIVEWAVFSTNGKPSGDQYSYKRPQRPWGVMRNGKPYGDAPESEISQRAYSLYLDHLRVAGSTEDYQLMATADWRNVEGLFAIEDAHVSHVEGIGILRMVYRPDTENTAQWYRDLYKSRNEALFFLEQARAAAFS